MVRALPRLVGVLVLVGVAFYGWHWLFPSEEDRVRRRLDALAADFSHASGDLALASAARIGTYFTEDVVVDPGGGREPVRGREVILTVARSLRAPEGGIEVSIEDADVTLAPGRTSAAVTLTAVLTRNAGTPEQTVDAREFALSMLKRDSEWQISHVTSIDTLR